MKLVFESPEGEELHFERTIAPTAAAAETFASHVGRPDALPPPSRPASSASSWRLAGRPCMHTAHPLPACRPACSDLQYKLNDRTVTWEQYNRKLEQFNILVKARNFLVFQVGAAAGCCHWVLPLELLLLLDAAGCLWLQLGAGPPLPPPPHCNPPPTVPPYRTAVPQGDIENVAQMQPRDLTALFEAISGSGAYRQQYEELEKKKAEAEEAVTYIFSKKKAIAQGGWAGLG